MFQNAGGKIKTLAVVLFVIGIIGSLVCAVVFGRTAPDRWGETQFSFLSFILILAVGVLSSFISSLFLYAFGDIADNIQVIASSALETAAAAKATAKAAEQTATSSAPVSSPKPAYSHKTDTAGDWVCKKCGTRNDKSTMFCKDCGEYR